MNGLKPAPLAVLGYPTWMVTRALIEEHRNGEREPVAMPLDYPGVVA